MRPPAPRPIYIWGYLVRAKLYFCYTLGAALLEKKLPLSGQRGDWSSETECQR